MYWQYLWPLGKSVFGVAPTAYMSALPAKAMDNFSSHLNQHATPRGSGKTFDKMRAHDVLAKRRHRGLVATSPTSFLPIWLAVHGADPVVDENYYQHGLKVNAELAQDQQARTRQIASELRIAGVGRHKAGATWPLPARKRSAACRRRGRSTVWRRPPQAGTRRRAHGHLRQICQ